MESPNYSDCEYYGIDFLTIQVEILNKNLEGNNAH